jgi:hypothetical protein
VELAHLQRAGAIWEPGSKRWLVQRRRIGTVIRALERTTDPLFPSVRDGARLAAAPADAQHGTDRRAEQNHVIDAASAPGPVERRGEKAGEQTDAGCGGDVFAVPRHGPEPQR